jgi:hypothetical protein
VGSQNSQRSVISKGKTLCTLSISYKTKMVSGKLNRCEDFYAMRNLQRKLVVLLSIVCATSSPLDLFGYGTTTHAQISFHAYDAASNIQANFFKALQIPSDQEFSVDSEIHNGQFWVLVGSKREDDDPLVLLSGPVPAARVIFHFFDPAFGQGLTFSSRACSAQTSVFAPEWAIFGEGSGVLGLFGIPVKTFSGVPNNSAYFPSPSPISTPISGARGHFLAGLTSGSPTDRNEELGLMFQSLGQVIHLIQDVSQPQHVRNDAHLNPSSDSAVGLLAQILCGRNPSLYETWVDNNFSTQTYAGYQIPFFDLPTKFFADGFGRGLAEFTNQNFVSRGTNCTTNVAGSCNSAAVRPDGTAGNYQLPIIDSSQSGKFVDLLYGGDFAKCFNYWSAKKFSAAQATVLCTTGQITFFGNTVHDGNAGTDEQNPYMTTFSVFDLDLQAVGKTPKFSLNEFNYARQAAFLIPRATAYSAGLLNYFFRGSMTAQGGASGFTITNTSMNGATPETMNGTFSLYYDDQSGNRQMVPGASWTLSIQGGATSCSLTFTAPINPAPAQPGQYTLVFQGTMGAEVGAVAAKAVQLSSATVGVTLNPFGNQTILGPYEIQVVDQQLNLASAPADITVTLLRDVISPCRGLLFSSNRTVTIPQGQSFATYDFNAGRDPFCNTLPITTQYTVVQATMQGKTLDLSFVPGPQLSLAVTR